VGTDSQRTMSTNAFEHEALFYAGNAEFLAATLPFVQEGVAAGEPVLVVLSAEKIEHVRDQLNGEGERVLFADMDEVGANPARIIPAWRRFLDEHGSAGTPVRGIGEPISAGRPPDELVECQRHEALLNLAFADVPAFRLVCPYDTAALDDHVIEEARRSHPYVLADGVRHVSPSFRGLEAIEAPFAEPLPAPPASVRVVDFDARSLSALRDVVTARAAEAGLDDRRTADLVLAVNEVATNSVRHGGGSGTLRIWVGTRWLVCEVEDAGRIDDPLAGRHEPRPGEHEGRGLWIANHVCDLVQVRTFADGSVVRLHMRRSR
jgi:anti-sigma regulatory factor (Ser/Thr protein kinase)